MINFFTVLRTVSHLKPTQIKYQLWYRIKRKLDIKMKYKKVEGQGFLNWKKSINWNKQWFGANKFNFVNITHDFNDKIDWNYSQFGKLWTYNLNYFDWLSQEDITKEDGLRLIKQYCNDYEILSDGLEPYPTSLRLINWTKFVGEHKISDSEIDQVIYNDALRLSSNLEYHLLANHLLENAFALVFAGIYLSDQTIFEKGEKLLVSQLIEQILPDGAHYELCPMYHQLMLLRVLDSIQLLQLNKHKSITNLLSFLRSKGALMLSWMEQITFKNGEIPNLGDSIDSINPSTERLVEYAESLKLNFKLWPVKESGYRMVKNERMECIVDVGEISPDYQPAHAHADTFHFSLHIDEQPFLVDTGLSTYERGERRNFERSTSAHNTVTINNENSSEVWSAHRVGRRANVSVSEDSDKEIEASHNGYRHLGKKCFRKWQFSSNQIIVSDEITNGSGVAHFHFHEDYSNGDRNENGFAWENIELQFQGATNIEVKKYERASSWNKLVEATKLEVEFTNKLGTIITWK